MEISSISIKYLLFTTWLYSSPSFSCLFTSKPMFVVWFTNYTLRYINVPGYHCLKSALKFLLKKPLWTAYILTVVFSVVIHIFPISYFWSWLKKAQVLSGNFLVHYLFTFLFQKTVDVWLVSMTSERKIQFLQLWLGRPDQLQILPYFLVYLFTMLQ